MNSWTKRKNKKNGSGEGHKKHGEERGREKEKKARKGGLQTSVLRCLDEAVTQNHKRNKRSTQSLRQSENEKYIHEANRRAWQHIER